MFAIIHTFDDAQAAIVLRDGANLNLDALKTELVRVVDETMQPEFVGLWVRDPQARSKTEAAQPDSKPPR